MFSRQRRQAADRALAPRSAGPATDRSGSCSEPLTRSRPRPRRRGLARRRPRLARAPPPARPAVELVPGPQRLAGHAVEPRRSRPRPGVRARTAAWTRETSSSGTVSATRMRTASVSPGARPKRAGGPPEAGRARPSPRRRRVPRTSGRPEADIDDRCPRALREDDGAAGIAGRQRAGRTASAATCTRPLRRVVPARARGVGRDADRAPVVDERAPTSRPHVARRRRARARPAGGTPPRGRRPRRPRTTGGSHAARRRSRAPGPCSSASATAGGDARAEHGARRPRRRRSARTRRASRRAGTPAAHAAPGTGGPARAGQRTADEDARRSRIGIATRAHRRRNATRARDSAPCSRPTSRARPSSRPRSPRLEAPRRGGLRARRRARSARSSPPSAPRATRRSSGTASASAAARPALLVRDYPGAAALARLPAEARAALELAAARIRAFHEHERDAGFRFEQDGIAARRARPARGARRRVRARAARRATRPACSWRPSRRASPASPRCSSRRRSRATRATTRCTPRRTSRASTAIVDAGGAQAIAALAYGTQSVPRVDKIVGPGNLYVACAKRLVFGAVDIDGIAGPSEILVVADDEADPRFVAADLLSQAEHDEAAYPLLVCASSLMAQGVLRELEGQLATLPRAAIARAALANGAAFVVASRERMAQVADRLAPEHLALHVVDPRALLARHPPRRRGVPRSLDARGRRGLRRRPFARPAHGGRRALRLTARRLRLRDPHLDHRVFAGGAGTARTRSVRASPASKGSRRTRGPSRPVISPQLTAWPSRF